MRCVLHKIWCWSLQNNWSISISMKIMSNRKWRYCFSWRWDQLSETYCFLLLLLHFDTALEATTSFAMDGYIKFYHYMPFVPHGIIDTFRVHGYYNVFELLKVYSKMFLSRWGDPFLKKQRRFLGASKSFVWILMQRYTPHVSILHV